MVAFFDRSTTPTYSKMSRSASEWTFQRFLQEASTSATSPPSSSSSSSVANDVFFVEIDERSKQDIGPAPLPNDAVLPNGPPSVVVDSDECQAFFKSKFNLACSSVAMTRVAVDVVFHTRDLLYFSNTLRPQAK